MSRGLAATGSSSEHGLRYALEIGLAYEAETPFRLSYESRGRLEESYGGAVLREERRSSASLEALRSSASTQDPPVDAGPEKASARELTRFLNELGRGARGASETLMPYVVDELRILANAHLRRQKAPHSLQPTALVNEAFLKLFDPDRVSWNDRHHFFALAAKAMRQILVDQARRGLRQKRGAGRQGIEVDTGLFAPERGTADLLAVDEALERLKALSERQARIVELRFFGGLEVGDVAEVLDVSASTVEREWRAARAYLHSQLMDSA